jgi:hypothetical protein
VKVSSRIIRTRGIGLYSENECSQEIHLGASPWKSIRNLMLVFRSSSRRFSANLGINISKLSQSKRGLITAATCHISQSLSSTPIGGSATLR